MDECLSVAIEQFRNGKYDLAVELLQKIDPADESIWMARFYLAMAYEKQGKIIEAHGIFKAICVMCSDMDIVMNAKNAMSLLAPKLRGPQATQLILKHCAARKQAALAEAV